MEHWNKIAYMVQLLAGCLVFLASARKRKHFVFIASTLSICLLILAYAINTFYTIPARGIIPGTYWAIYVIVCIGFVWSCLDGTFMQAVYCTIFACGMQHIAFDIYLICQLSGKTNTTVAVLCYVVVYGLFFRFVAGKLTEKGEFASSRRALIPVATIILIVLIFSVLEVSEISGMHADAQYRIMYRILDAVCCFYVIWVQLNLKERMSLQRELDGINAVFQQQKKQYEITSETIDTINRKCHDLKHQLRAIREMTDEKEKNEYFDEIENAIMIYDTALNTGNKALDTVLMEKGLFCQGRGIQWSCMADGRQLGFMKKEDIYAIFGNALDNAIQAVMGVDDPAKRVISVKVISQNQLLVIQIQNYYEGELKFEKDLPVTTKKQRSEHGYGMKSIRYTVERYNGTITVQGKNQIFNLQILLPAVKIS